MRFDLTTQKIYYQAVPTFGTDSQVGSEEMQDIKLVDNHQGVAEVASGKQKMRASAVIHPV